MVAVTMSDHVTTDGDRGTRVVPEVLGDACVHFPELRRAFRSPFRGLRSSKHSRNSRAAAFWRRMAAINGNPRKDN